MLQNSILVIVSFDGVENITPDIAAAISQWSGKQLDLNNLQHIDENFLAEIMHCKIDKIYLGLGPEGGIDFVLPGGTELRVNTIDKLSPQAVRMLKPFWLHRPGCFLDN